MSGLIDLVYSAAQDSDFLLYPGMGEIMYDLKADGSFHAVSLERDVLGKRVGSHDFSKWESAESPIDETVRSGCRDPDLSMYLCAFILLE